MLPDQTGDRTEEVQLPDRYQVKGTIGRGGMATVYLAWDRLLGRDVAVKVLRPELAGAVAVERFLRETRLSESLAHPGIVPLIDSGQFGGLPFLVMPVVTGGSLRERLTRERQLGVNEAVRIVRDVAAALDAAHAVGVIHRDVKPGNILLDTGGALLGDFGIARAFMEASREKLTESGIAIGTPGYMSPEQVERGHSVDARTDVYALAAVAYEMLAGEPPYSGPSAQAVVAKQLALPVPSLSVVRDTLPDSLDAVMRKALAKVPADRYQSAGEFAVAFGQAATALPSVWTRLARQTRRRRRSLLSASAIIVTIALAGLYANNKMIGMRAAISRDTTRYLILVPSGAVSGAPVIGVPTLLASLRRWNGLTAVDARDGQDGVIIDATASHRQVSRLAGVLEAGRYVHTELTEATDGTSIRMRLFDAAAPGRAIAESMGHLTSGSSGAELLIGLLLDSLLLRDALPGDPLAGNTRSLPARQAHIRGQRALDEWSLAAADSAFESATRFDPSYVDAQLHLALVRVWRGAEPARWRIAAEQAALGGKRLRERDKLMSDAVVAHARGDLETACAAWHRLIARDSLDGMAMFGAAHCLASDNAVIRDPSTPSGWRFRTSYFHALRLYQRSFELHPPILASFGRGGLDALRRLFKTAGNQLRRGRSAVGTLYSGNMEWQGDSLVFIPYPWTGEHVSLRFSAVAEAMRRQRELLRQVAASWVTTSPSNGDAWLLLTEALGALGATSALDTLTRARALARTTNERLRVAATEAALQLGFALRDRDTTRLRRVRRLADSVLSGTEDGRDPRVLAGMAALTGRASRAARYAERPEASEWLGIPLTVSGVVPRLLVYSAFGGPVDTLRVLERAVADLIERSFPPEERLRRRLEWLARGASMAFPTCRFESLETLAADGDPLVALQVAAARGDSGRVRRGLETMRRERLGVLPEDIALDALAPEAALFVGLGDYRSAAEWLDPTLAALPQAASQLLLSPIQSAALGVALTLRWRAAASDNSVGADFWRAAVAILWSDADLFLKARFREIGG